MPVDHFKYSRRAENVATAALWLQNVLHHEVPDRITWPLFHQNQFSLTTMKTPIWSFHLPGQKVHFVVPGDKIKETMYNSIIYVRKMSHSTCIKDKRLPGKLAFCFSSNWASFLEPHLHPKLLKLSPSISWCDLHFKDSSVEQLLHYMLHSWGWRQADIESKD